MNCVGGVVCILHEDGHLYRSGMGLNKDMKRG
jgi:hypothetical protein